MNNLPISTPEEMHEFIERNKTSGFSDLEPRERAFALEYILDYNHRRAADKTGYGKDKGIRLLRNPLVSAYIAHLQEFQQTSAIITKDFINQQRLELLDMAKGNVPIRMVTPDGEEYMARKTTVGEANNILRDLSKSTEYEKDTGSKTAPVNIHIDMGNIFGDDTPPVIDITPDVIDNG